MSRPDIDGRIRDILRSSTERASPGFNHRVLERLEHPRHRSIFLPRPALAAVALLLFVLGGALGLMVGRSKAPGETAAAQRERLLEEYRALESELEQIRELATDQAPALYLGGDESFDVLYDLGDYQQANPQGIRPASFPDRG